MDLRIPPLSISALTAILTSWLKCSCYCEYWILFPLDLVCCYLCKQQWSPGNRTWCLISVRCWTGRKRWYVVIMFRQWSLHCKQCDERQQRRAVTRGPHSSQLYLTFITKPIRAEEVRVVPWQLLSHQRKLHLMQGGGCWMAVSAAFFWQRHLKQ